MKEKIKTIILLVIFVVLLIFINNMLDESNVNENNVANINENLSVENEVNIERISSSYENEIEDIITNKVDDELVNSKDDSSSKEDVVIKVTETTFEKEVLNSDKKVLIDFYADWCNPCKVLSPIVEEVAKENPDLKVVKINVDENENLAYKYRAYSIPTLVVIENGEEVERAVGAIPKESILDLVK